MTQFTYSMSTRLILALFVPSSLVASGLLFLALAKITQPADMLFAEQRDIPQLDFLLVREDMNVEYRDRKPLPTPETMEEFDSVIPKSKLELDTLNIEVEQLSIVAPNIEMGLAVDLSPALASLSSAVAPAQMFAVDMPFQTDLKTIKHANPRYPSHAQRKKIEGRLQVEFIVDEKGHVKEGSIKFLEADPQGVFENSVIRSLKRSRFEPLQRSAEPVAYRARKTYHFKMPK